MNRVQALFKKTWLGLMMVAVAAAAAYLLTQVWDIADGWYDWRAIVVAALLLQIIALAGIEELGRPQNPYRNLDPRFSYMDAAPTGGLSSASTGWLWHTVPPLVLVLAIVASWLLL